MSSVEISQVLAQMRVMASAASNVETAATAQSGAPVDFGTLMKDSMAQVNEVQQNAKELRTAFESGDESVNLPEVMVALQKSSLSFQAMTQVRNKLLTAYKEVMNMPV